MTALDTPAPPVARGDKRPIVYCRSCLIPETKPDILFDDQGVCSACRPYESRGEVDWDARRRELEQVLDRYRSPDGTTYDCIIGVSGDKDSTTQVIRMLELGMNPLCVTATTDERSDIGRRNIENLKGSRRSSRCRAHAPRALRVPGRRRPRASAACNAPTRSSS